MRLVDALPEHAEGARDCWSVSSEWNERSSKLSRRLSRTFAGGIHFQNRALSEEEADETALWLELIVEDRLLPEKKVAPLLKRSERTDRDYGRLLHLRIALHSSRYRGIRNQQSEIRNQKYEHEQRINSSHSPR